MCQLLGMNCNVPTDILFSFEGFRARGGKTDEHEDGWGIAFFEGKGCRLFLDDQASITSPVAEFVRRYPIRSKNVIAHIRKATHGPVALENTHPFMRELWGQYWIFAHNGDLQHYAPDYSDNFSPVGTTDSEAAFCAMLAALHHHFGDHAPSVSALTEVLRDISDTIARYGSFNYMLSNGHLLVVYCSTQLSYIVRQAPFSKAHLIDEDITVDFREVTTPDDRVAVIASKPLTDNETWSRMAPGNLLIFTEGAPLDSTK